MNRLRPAYVLVLGLSAVFAAPAQAAGSFPDVWAATSSGPYDSLPQYRTSYSKFFSGGIDLLANSAERTLHDQDDILPRFQKLVHPIGICFAGTWKITAPSAYTGYFANGSEGLIIVRASEAMGAGEAGDYRAFGLAGKIFPTKDATDQTPYPTANFFTVDDLGGADSNSFFDLPKTNEPDTTPHLSHLGMLATITKIARTFSAADSNPGIRQVYEISELTVGPQAARTPHWMALVPENTERTGDSDFRNELRLANYPGGLVFGIQVADQDGEGFRRIGEIRLTKEALSDGCDHRLHFHHPQAK